MAYNKLRIAKIVEETPDARSFVLEVPADLADKFRYRAGQFLTFRVPHPEGAFNRCYSLSSAPETDGLPKVTVKRVEGGKGSNWFHDALKEGRTLRRAAAGRPLRAGRRRCAPAAVRRRQRHHADDVADQVGAEARARAASACSMPTATSPRSSSTRSWSRLLAAPHRPAGGDPSSRCRAGPDQAGRDHRGPQGLRERRGLSVRARAVHDAGREHAARRRHAARESAPRALRGLGQRRRADRAAGGRRRDPERDHHPFRGQGAQGAVPQGPAILEAARAAGLNPLSSCEEGFCASCAAKRIKGKIVLAKNDIYTPDDLANNWILTCQGHCFGPEVEITYDVV